MTSFLFALFAAAATPTDTASVLAAADAFDRAQLTQDEEAMERMVLDDLIFITVAGKRVGKKELINGWMHPHDKHEPVTPTDRIVRPLGPDAAVVNAEAVICTTNDGDRSCARVRYADTFVRIAGQWRVAHIQVKPVAD